MIQIYSTKCFIKKQKRNRIGAHHQITIKLRLWNLISIKNIALGWAIGNWINTVNDLKSHFSFPEDTTAIFSSSIKKVLIDKLIWWWLWFLLINGLALFLTRYISTKKKWIWDSQHFQSISFCLPLNVVRIHSYLLSNLNTILSKLALVLYLMCHILQQHTIKWTLYLWVSK